MFIDLPPQTFINPQEQYVVAEPIVPRRAIECIQDPDSKCRQKTAENGDFGGHFAVTTTASGTASGVTQSMTQFTPWDYPIPSLEIQLNFEAHNMEIKPELRSK